MCPRPKQKYRRTPCSKSYRLIWREPPREAPPSLGGPTARQVLRAARPHKREGSSKGRAGTSAPHGRGRQDLLQAHSRSQPARYNSRTAAERVTVKWLKERVKRRRWGEDAPPIPTHLR